MKARLFNVLLLLAAVAVIAYAADNDMAAPKYRTDAAANQVKIATTDSAGVHTQKVIVASTTGAQRTPTITTATGSGTVSAGARKLTFIFSTDFAGTVLGATFAGSADASVTIDAPADDTLAAVAYTISAGSARILKVQ